LRHCFWAMSLLLEVEGTKVKGQLALPVPPGTVKATRDALLDEHLTEPLFEIAKTLGLVLAADPHDYARPVDGHDEQGQTRFVICGLVEGDRLVPEGRGRRRRRG
jgi:hypothetical protein